MANNLKHLVVPRPDKKNPDKVWWQKIGAMGTSSKGKIWVHIEALPIIQGWDGFAMVVEPGNFDEKKDASDPRNGISETERGTEEVPF